jgi:hypothetical protein
MSSAPIFTGNKILAFTQNLVMDQALAKPFFRPHAHDAAPARGKNGPPQHQLRLVVNHNSFGCIEDAIGVMITPSANADVLRFIILSSMGRRIAAPWNFGKPSIKGWTYL